MSEIETPTDGTGHLVDGRRVRLADLLRADLLRAGAQLEFHRVRVDERHQATVLPDGRLRLGNGQAYGSPSLAAGAAIGGPVDGWYAWRVVETGDLLAHLRQRLLDETTQVDGSPAAAAVSPTALARHDFLRRAREAADTDRPIKVPVRQLIANWHAKTRGRVVTERIENDLDNYGLVTEPHFRKVGLDSRVALVAHAAVDSPQNEKGGVAVGGERVRHMPGISGKRESLSEVGMTLGNIPSAYTEVASVKPGATYNEAITLMLLNDYSQLAVMTAPPRGLTGAITWRSIAKEWHTNPESNPRDAVVPAKQFRFDTDLIDVLPTLQLEDFVFVTDAENRITGIVTAADVVQAYGELATPFFLMGELDQILRRIVADTFSIEDVRRLCDRDRKRSLESHDDMTMGDYQCVLQNEDSWEVLGWPLDRKVFSKTLNELRETRNDIMHFNPDPVSDEVVGRLRAMIRLLRRFA